MSIEAAIIQYRQAFIDQFEGRSSVMRLGCTKETVTKGNQATFLVAGSGTDTAVTRGTNSLIPYGNPTNTQFTTTLVEKHAPYQLTGFNIFASQGDQKTVMRQASMAVINRDIDLTILAELANSTIDTGASATATVAMVEKAKGYLGNQDVPIEEEDNMFAVVSSGFLAYLRQTTEFTSSDYIDYKPLVGPTRRMLRWNGVNWMLSPRITGTATATELCYMWHRNAIGYAINVGEENIFIGYDDKHDISWTRATVYHGAKVLQNTGIVQMKHDGSAFALV